MPKLTHEQTVEVLKYCSEHSNCKGCQLFTENNCTAIKTKNAIDLINRLKADNERLLARNFELSEKGEKGEKVCIALKTAKTEAYKELGKILIDKSENGVISASDIPDIVVEMVGEG